MTLSTALDRYLKEVTPTKRESTRLAEARRAETLRDEFGAYALAALSPTIIAGYRDERLATGKANNTVRLELALLSHVFTTAIREWSVGLAFSPVANVRKPSAGTGRNRRLAPDEEKRLFEELRRHRNPMLTWIARTVLLTAMRQGEILSLRRNQVDRARRIVRLDQTKNGDSRIVPLSREAATVFREVLKYLKTMKMPGPLLFLGEPGKVGHRRPYAVHKVWIASVARAGLEDFRFHDLRHEAVSRLVEAGLTEQLVSAISGHRSMQMLKRYTHLRGEDLVGELDRVLG